ncbi:hypothetical protein [Thermococcus sp. P6]|uniref:hypothetical protein n=1 Tax=Thermococcus sp. P6 TaxID=122420 RepID=UPI001E349EB7|nr:hypothetical protein [Thermococcus sp. P6]
MTVLNDTTIEVKGRLYRYAVLGIWNVSFSGEAQLEDYKVLWGQRKNITSTGGQEINFKIYSGEKVVDSFTYYYVPFQLDSFCVSVNSRRITLPNGDELTFLFMHTERGDLWLLLLA